ncbi:MAG: selenocysteine-specific translation elongation factor [Thermodesulfobacteriota bacterium]
MIIRSARNGASYARGPALAQIQENGKPRVMDKSITIGVAGHVDHGKTSLVRCLTGIDTDRLKEEKRRGLSIEPSIAPLDLPSGSRVALVDVPGHSDFLRNTIRGLSSVDLAILVVAADDGVMPQTRDHLAVLKFLQAKGGFTVLSKADLVDSETIELAEMELREAVEGSFLEGKPVLPFSAVDGNGQQEILAAVESEAERVEAKGIQGPFRLWVDQVRGFPGFGTVVSGTVVSGSIGRDETVELLPSGKLAKVRFIEVHHQRVELAVAGQRVGLNLQNVSIEDVSLGTVLATPGLLSPANLLNAELTLVPSARRPLLNHQRVRLYVGASCTTALLVMMENNRLYPTETGLVQLRLQEPLAVLPRDPLVISPLNLRCVIGGGKVLETTKEKFRRAKAEKTLGLLHPLQREDVKSIVSLYLLKFSSRPVTEEEIVSATGFPRERVGAEIQSRMRAGKVLRVDSRGFYDRSRYESLKRQIVDVAKKIFSKDAFKLAVSGDEIRFQLDSNLDNALFERMLDELCSEGTLTKNEAGYRIPNFVVRHPAQRERLVQKVSEFARERGIATFSVGTFKKLLGGNVSYREVEKVFDHLHAQKRLIRLNDDRFLAVEAMTEIKEKVTDLIMQKGSLAIGDCQDIFGYGRTRAIPVLDYLDSIGLTCRVGEVRVLASESGQVGRQGRR